MNECFLGTGTRCSAPSQWVWSCSISSPRSATRKFVLARLLFQAQRGSGLPLVSRVQSHGLPLEEFLPRSWGTSGRFRPTGLTRGARSRCPEVQVQIPVGGSQAGAGYLPARPRRWTERGSCPHPPEERREERGAQRTGRGLGTKQRKRIHLKIGTF